MNRSIWWAAAAIGLLVARYTVADNTQSVVITGHVPCVVVNDNGSCGLLGSDWRMPYGWRLGARLKHEDAQNTMREPAKQQKPDVQDNSRAPNCTDPKQDLPTATPHPVMVATGEKVKEEADFDTTGLYSLSLHRTYRSQHATGKLFGAHWLSSLDPGVVTPSGQCYAPLAAHGCVPDAYIHTASDGTVTRYDFSSTDGWDPETGAKPNYFIYRAQHARADDRLVKWGADRTFTRIQGDLAEHFNLRGNQTDALLGGEPLRTFVYDEMSLPQKLQSVALASGLAVHFTYTGNVVTQVTDPSGNAWTFEYNGAGMLAKVTSPGLTPEVRVYHYEDTDPGRLTGITYGGERYSTYTYYADGRVKSSALAGGDEAESFTYEAGRTTVLDARGQQVRYDFKTVNGELKPSSVARLETSTCSAATRQIDYDGNGFASKSTDFRGNVRRMSYDDTGQLKRVTSADGTADALTVDYDWVDGRLHLVTYRDAAGVAYATMEYAYRQEYPGRARVASITTTDTASGVKRSTTYAYTLHSGGTIAQISESVALPEGAAVTTTAFDPSGRITSVTNPVGHVVTMSEFTGLGQAQKLVDVNGAGWRFGYNLTGTLAMTTDPAQRTVSRYYNARRQLTTVALPDGRRQRYGYAASGRLLWRGNGLDERVLADLDIGKRMLTTHSARRVPTFLGGAISTIPAGEFKAVEQFDSLGRTYAALGQHGQRTDFRYDNEGNLTLQQDAEGSSASYTHDAQNRVASLTLSGHGTVKAGYDGAGRLARIEDARQIVTTYGYNGFGQPTGVTSADVGSTTYAYDSAGRLTRTTLADGKELVYTADALNRMRSRTSGDAVEHYNYDEGWYGKGRLTSVSDGTGRTGWNYSASGALTAQTSVVFGKSYTTAWEYNGKGQLASMTYPNGLKLVYSYDAQGRRTALLREGVARVTLVDSLQYQPATEQLYAWRFSNGLPRMLTFDEDGRLSELDGSPAHHLRYDFGRKNNLLTGIDDQRYASASIGYGYDAGYRVNSATRSGDNQSFDWDDAVNRVRSARDGSDNASYTTNPSNNRLDRWSAGGHHRTFHYGAGGEVTGESRDDGERVYGYDSFNRLSRVQFKGATLGEYRYNALDQRVYRSAGGMATTSLYGPGGELIAEVVGQTTIDYVWLDHVLVGVWVNDTFYGVHSDHLGRPEVITAPDRTVVWRAVNGPFDRRVVSNTLGTDINLGFPGQYFDRETGLWYNRKRYYDPAIGRYLQADPSGMAGGVNPYVYAGGNPVSRVDAEGLRWVIAAIWMASADSLSVGHVFVGELNGAVILSQFPAVHGMYGANRTLSWEATMAAEARRPDYVFQVFVKNDSAFDKAAQKERDKSLWSFAPSLGFETNCAVGAKHAFSASGMGMPLPDVSLVPDLMAKFFLFRQALGSNYIRQLDEVPW